MPEESQLLKREERVILLAEDDELVRNLVQAILSRDGYTVLSAGDGIDALEVSRAYSGEIQLLLADVRMPRMDGIELSRQIRNERPDIKVLLMSGKLSGEALVTGRLMANFLRKPFLAETLRSRVKTML